MKKLMLFIAVVMFAPLFLMAQGDPELDYIKDVYSKEKKTIVEEYMDLDVQDGAKFWPIYGDYESKREKLASERIKLIKDYVDNFANLTPELADKTASSALTNNISLSKLNLDYYKKVKKALGPVRAAKFIQLETYLQNAWRTYVQDNIPEINELDKTQKH